MKGDSLIVIPARIGSTRFPKKVLQPLGSIPVIEWCRRAAVKADCGPVVVATDSKEVREIVIRFGGRAVMTPAGCRSGTDRAHAALGPCEKIFGRRFASVINVQGDEPFIRPQTIRKVTALVTGKSPAEMATAYFPLRDRRAANDPNRVKTAVSLKGRCLYFSRAAIPYGRNASPRFFQHVGIYGFTRNALARFVRYRPTPLEKTESLEQLRALEHGMIVMGARVAETSLSIDTPQDLARAKRWLKARSAKKTKRRH